MFDPETAILLIPLLPLAASAVIAVFGYPLLRQHSHWPCILGAASSCVLSVLALTRGSRQLPLVYYQWFGFGDAGVRFAFHVDGLTLIMLVTVTFVGTLITIYSAGYLRGDPGYPRYFAVVSLFLFSMTGLVLADNLILLYAFWEGVGVCSYLLIGFWFTRPSAAAAARKAFLVTRIGDAGLLLGILVIWANFKVPAGASRVALLSFDFNTIFAAAPQQSQGLLLVATIGAIAIAGRRPEGLR